MHGAGNDFVMIDKQSNDLELKNPSLVQKLCHRRFGIGADGLILIDFTSTTHFKMIYYNADGYEAEMCGNGARCAVHFAHLKYPEQKEFEFEISGRTYRGLIIGQNLIRILWNAMPRILDSENFKRIISSEFDRYLYIDSGVPHLILQIHSSLEKFDIMKWGKFYRNNAIFKPSGTNVDFIRISDKKIQMRTFERGVEKETMACGTGAIAAATAVLNWKLLKLPVEILTAGGILKVGTDQKESFWLEGPVQVVYGGSFDIALFSSDKMAGSSDF